MNQDVIPWLYGVDQARVALVVAHQDDEAFVSSLFRRCPGMLVVHVTDGAPREKAEWKGLSSRDEYATLRENELVKALAVAGHTGKRATLGVIDSSAPWRMRYIINRLSGIFADTGTQLVFTHAFEGGHPDHDAVACAVHSAAKGLRIIESPFYRMEGPQSVWQKFVPIVGLQEFVVHLTDEEVEVKHHMFAAHQSQNGMFFSLSGSTPMDRELFREAPPYDFLSAANSGQLSRNYHRAQIDGELWRSLAVLADVKKNGPPQR